jgi:hypothetical protein
MIITSTEPVGTGSYATKALSPNEAPAKNNIIGSFRRMGFLTPEQACEKFGGEVEPMIFPQDVHLTTQEREIIRYPAGRHDVPVELSGHPYLKANGVTTLSAPPVRELQPTLAGNVSKTAPLEK